MEKIPLLLTRPARANSDFVERFPDTLAERLDLVACPLMRIVGLAPRDELPARAAAIFTSANGVRFAPPALGRMAFCVGHHTTEMARAAGWDAVCAGQTADALLDHVLTHRPTLPLYHLGGLHQRGDIVERLAAAGLSATRLVIYDQQLLPLPPAALRLLKGQDPVLVPLFSPRSAAHFAKLCPAPAPVQVIALSEAVAAPARARPDFLTTTAVEPTAAAVIEALCGFVARNRLG